MNSDKHSQPTPWTPWASEADRAFRVGPMARRAAAARRRAAPTFGAA